jgi:hypothetical protein
VIIAVSAEKQGAIFLQGSGMCRLQQLAMAVSKTTWNLKRKF